MEMSCFYYVDSLLVGTIYYINIGKSLVLCIDCGDVLPYGGGSDIL